MPDRAAFERELRPDSRWTLNSAPPEAKVESILALIDAGHGVNRDSGRVAKDYVRNITRFSVVHSLGWRLVAAACLVLGVTFLIAGGAGWWALLFIGIMLFVAGAVAGGYIVVLWRLELRNEGQLGNEAPAAL
jgi:hypothetical protein